MKKSFLITLAALSTVALIGCSSSDDSTGGKTDSDNNTEQTPPPVEPTTPTVIIDNASLVKHASDTAFIKIPLKVAGKEKAENAVTYECTFNENADTKAGEKTCASELGFALGTEGNVGSIFVDSKKLQGLDKQTFTITVKDDNATTPLTISKKEIDGFAKTHLVEKFTVAEAKTPDTQIKDLTVDDKTGKEIVITATSEHIVSYASANAEVVEFNVPGADAKAVTKPLNFHTVAFTETSDPKFLLEAPAARAGDKTSCKDIAKASPVTKCNGIIKAKATESGRAAAVTDTLNLQGGTGGNSGTYAKHDVLKVTKQEASSEGTK